MRQLGITIAVSTFGATPWGRHTPERIALDSPGAVRRLARNLGVPLEGIQGEYNTTATSFRPPVRGGDLVPTVRPPVGGRHDDVPRLPRALDDSRYGVHARVREIGEVVDARATGSRGPARGDAAVPDGERQDENSRPPWGRRAYRTSFRISVMAPVVTKIRSMLSERSDDSSG